MRGVGVRGWKLVAAALLVGSVTGGVGCGGSGKPSTTASGCTSACNRCASELCADCAATSARLRDEFENAVYACVLQGSDAACDAIWSSCIVQAEGSLTPRPADTTYRDACLAKKSTCDASGTTFADDDCLLSPILDEALVAQAQDCLSRTCDTIAACFQPLFD